MRTRTPTQIRLFLVVRKHDAACTELCHRLLTRFKPSPNQQINITGLAQRNVAVDHSAKARPLYGMNSMPACDKRP
jgi:hypothetical protein